MLDASSKTLLTHRMQKPITSFFKFFMINNKQSRLFEYFHFLCSEIQYLAILIWLQSTLITYNDHSLPSLFTRSLCKVIAFKDTLEYNFPVSFLSVLSITIWLYLGIFSLVIVCLVLMAIKARDIAKPTQTILSYIFQLHFGVIFWYINVVLIVNIILQKKGEKLPLFADIADQEVAFHLIQGVIMVFNYAFGIITALCCFDPLRSNNLFAVQTPYFQFLTFSFKAVMPHFAAASSNNVVYQIIFIIFSVLISTTRLVHLFRNFPFHNHKSTIPPVISATIAAWVSFNSIIAFIWDHNDLIRSISPVYLMIFVLPVIIKLSLNRLRNSIKFYLDIDAKNLKTTREIYGKLFAYQYLSETVKLSMNENVKINSSELYFLKDLNHHSVTCQDKECLCSASHTTKNDGKLLDIVNKTKSLLLPYFHARCYNVLIDGIEKIKKNAELKITMAQLIVANSAHRLNSALIYLFGAADQELNVLKRVEKHILVKKIQCKMLSELRHNSEQKINIADFIDYQTDAAHFLSQIISITTQYLNFWEAYRKSNLKMADVMRKSNDIENSANLIEKLWSYNISKYQCFYHLMKEPYGVYLSLVRNTPYASKENIRKLKWKKKGQGINPASSIITASDLASSKVLSFQVSMMRERIGKVISVSENINGSLGFTAQEIIGKNINCLMPASYADKHDQILLNYLDKAKVSESKDFGAVMGYIKTKAGPILPCSIYITLFPYIQRELAYIGIVKVLKMTSESIIVSKNGYIDCFTKNIGRKLNLLIDKKTHLRDICVDFDKIESYFEIKSKKFTPNSKYKDSPAFDFSLNLDGTLPTLLTQTPGKRPTKDFKSIKMTLIFTKDNIQAGHSKYSVQLIKKTMESKEFYVLEMEYTGEAEIAPSSSKRVFFNDEIIKNSDDDFDNNVPTERPFITKTQDGSETLRTREGKSGYQRMRTNSTKAAMDLDTSNGRKRTSYFGNPYNAASRLDLGTGALESADDITEKEPVKIQKKVSGLGPDMHNNDFLHIESERGSIASSTNNMHKKLEKAIYTLPQDKSLTVLKIFSVIFIVICILLLVLFRLQTENKLELVKGNVSVMSISNLRLFEISEINRRTRVISMLRAGLINDNRYLVFGIRSIFPTVSVVLNLVQKNLNTYNSEVRIALEKIEPHLQKQLLNNVIPIYDPDDQLSLRYATIFDAATMLIIETKQLIDTTPALITQNNPEMNFLLNNTLNEQLLVSEQVTNVVLNDNDIKLNFLKSLTLYFIAIWLVIGGLIMALFCYNQLRSFQSRTKFIELFLRLTNEEIEHAMNSVKSFRNLLTKNGFDFKSSQIEESLAVSSYSVNLARESVKGSRYLKKNVDLKGINYRVIVAFLLAFSFLLLLLIPFIYISIIVNKKKEVINTQVDMIVKVNSILSDMNVLSSAIYEYIQYNGTTTVRTKPIGPELEASFARLDGAQAFFSDLLEVKSGSKIVTDSEFEQLLTGNLCHYLNISQALCSLVKGVLDQGMIGMNSFIYMTLRNVKDVFDYSDKSFTSAKQALSANNLINIELIYFLMQLPAYQKLGAILQARIDGHIQDVDEVLKLLVIISICIYIVFGLMISVCLWKVIEEEKVKWKKMFRKVPFKVVISNKVFTSYLVRESDQTVKK